MLLVFHSKKIGPPTFIVSTSATLQQHSSKLYINTHTHRVSTHGVICGVSVTVHRLRTVQHGNTLVILDRGGPRWEHNCPVCLYACSRWSCLSTDTWHTSSLPSLYSLHLPFPPLPSLPTLLPPISTAWKIFMKQKAWKDRVVIKRKLQNMEKEWDTEFILHTHTCTHTHTHMHAHKHTHSLLIDVEGRVCSEVCQYLYSNFDDSTYDDEFVT